MGEEQRQTWPCLDARAWPLGLGTWDVCSVPAAPFTDQDVRSEKGGLKAVTGGQWPVSQPAGSQRGTPRLPTAAQPGGTLWGTGTSCRALPPANRKSGQQGSRWPSYPALRCSPSAAPGSTASAPSAFRSRLSWVPGPRRSWALQGESGVGAPG